VIIIYFPLTYKKYLEKMKKLAQNVCTVQILLVLF